MVLVGLSSLIKQLVSHRGGLIKQLVSHRGGLIKVSHRGGQSVGLS